MHVRYWDNNHIYAGTRYFHSEFIGKAYAKGVFDSYSACIRSSRPEVFRKKGVLIRYQQKQVAPGFF